MTNRAVASPQSPTTRMVRLGWWHDLLAVPWVEATRQPVADRIHTDSSSHLCARLYVCVCSL